MNYVDSLDMFCVEVKEIPCIKFVGEPTTSTVGAVGLLGMDIDSGNLYKCVAVSAGKHIWKPVANDGEGVVDAVRAIGTKIINKEITSVVLLGDSITDGAGGSDYNGSFTGEISTNTAGYCWANALKKFLNERYETTVQNLGMYGTVMSVQLEKAKEIVTENDFVIWLTGTNDRWDSNTYKSNLKSTIDAIKAQSAGILVVSNIPSTESDENEKPVTMQAMDEIVAGEVTGHYPYFSMYQAFLQYCDQSNISLVDCFADHVHPNDLGYYVMFKIMCQSLGLPLDPHADYHYSGAWWGGTQASETEILLLDSTDDYGQTPTDFVYLLENVVPVVLMDNYDSSTQTTAVSGKKITRVVLDVREAGTITIGTVDLNTVGSSTPTFTQSAVIAAATTGFVEFTIDMEVGEHETLAFQQLTDTGHLGFVVMSGDMFIWQSSDFAAGTKSTDLILYGKVYAYSENANADEDTTDPGSIIHTSQDEYDNLDNPVATIDGVVPLVLMDGYDSGAKTTDYSGKRITKLNMYVASSGTITFGAVDLNTVGSAAPTFTNYKQVTVQGTGWTDMWINLDIGANETLAMQSTSDSGQLMFNVRSGELTVWQASEFEAGASSTTIIMVGTVYGKVVTDETPEDEGDVVTAIDFSNFSNGSFTEVVNGETITHTVTFDDSGNPASIDGVTLTWPEETT